MTSTPIAKGAVVGAALALVWVEWGIGATIFVVLAALLGAFVAAAVSGQVDLAQMLRDLQDRS